jgi:hypothetical protein
MSSVIVKKILDRSGEKDLVRLLSDELSGTELNSLLLEVFHQRVSKQSPAQLLKQYQLNRFVKPADLPMLELKQIEIDLLRIFQKCLFETIELSPVAALGTCSIVAPANQKKVLSALRGTEVLADATNAIALHISDLKKQKLWVPKTAVEKLRLGTIQRHVRTQSVSVKGFTPHFKIGCLVTSGMDTGNYGFEKEALAEHFVAMKKIFSEFYKVDQLGFRLVCRGGYPDSIKLAIEVKKFIQQHHPDTDINVIETSEKEIGYYKGIQYKVDITWKDKTFEIADGGFVDWTQKLLQNKKERLLITGFGFELMYRITRGLL